MAKPIKVPNPQNPNETLEIDAYVSVSGGRLLAMVRADDEDTFNQRGLEVGILKYTNPAQPEVLDPETGDVVTPAQPASGPIIPVKGVDIFRIGAFVLTPGEYDQDGNEITAPTFDTRYHVNFWLSPELVANEEWKSWAATWGIQGNQVSIANRNEKALKFQGIELIDPATVATPYNVML